MTEHERVKELAYAIHAEARSWSNRKAYVVGSIMRGCANRILWTIGEQPLPYEGPREEQAS